MPDSSPSPAYDLQAVRRQIPLLRRAVPLNSCSQGPQMLATRKAARAFLSSWDRRGMDWPGWIEEVEAARSEFAALINASPEEVAVTTSVSAAAASVASALDFTAGRPKVLVSEGEFPSVAHVFQAFGRFGARVQAVPSAAGRDGASPYRRYVDRRTALVSACHGLYRNGDLQDVAGIAERCRAAGALLFVDAYQTAGVVPVDVRGLGADFLAAGCLKYLMGTAGIAFLYVRRELHSRLKPAFTGWFGRRDPFSFRQAPLDWAPSARRFDTGTPAVINAFIARAGMEAIRELGVKAIADWTGELSRCLLSGCRERGFEVDGEGDWHRKTPSTAILCDRAADVEQRLRARGILASARGPAIRLAPHFFTSREDVDRALDALVEVLPRP